MNASSADEIEHEDEEVTAVREVAIEAVGGAIACHQMVAPGGIWIEPESSPLADSLARGEFIDREGSNLVQGAHMRAGNYLAVSREHMWSMYRLLQAGVVNLGLLSLGRVAMETATRAWHLACAEDSDEVRVARFLNEHISDGAQEATIARAHAAAAGDTARKNGTPGRRQVARDVCSYAAEELGLPLVTDREARPLWVLEARPDAHEVAAEFQARMGYPAGEWAYRVLCAVVHGSMPAFDVFSVREDSLDDHRHVHGPDAVRIIEVAVRCPTHAYFESILRMSDRYETGRTEDFGIVGRMTDAALHRLYELVHELRPAAAE